MVAAFSNGDIRGFICSHGRLLGAIILQGRISDTLPHREVGSEYRYEPSCLALNVVVRK